MASLENLAVIVTGGAGGLGKAIATAFLAAGSQVAVCDVSAPRIAEVTTEWEASHSGKFIAATADITDEAASQAFVDSVVAKFGKLDMLINNAGIMDSFDPIGTTDKTVWDRVMNVNVTGLFLMTKAAVNGTMAGAAYTASKHAVLGLTKNTAGFYGDKGIYSIVLLVGAMTNTNIVDAFALSAPNQANMGVSHQLNPGFNPATTGVPLEDVAKYCIFYADRNVAHASNGSTITVNKNWPVA
ncbi:unnamed protein product [Parascedosporium putredinis]|uniref:Uncharacterized protein n=1 Tax=Parascedosporium putredinis TaxID=1442378 RepID=A0A9P1H0E0_9PEZI|nr:unnamed protein product [Parascedosporium putredinis]CAI7991707.1 unnamed protein product [Parascedosporium putredinis]